MQSIAWDGDRAVNQPWGCTTYTAEPWYPADGCYFHCGIDIDFSLGEEIRGARPGDVLAVGTGFLVMQNGTEADWYLHCSSYVVARGQNVARRQLIGYAGSVAPPHGASSGVHLHFERQSTLALYCNIPATSLDPVPILAPTYSGGGGSITGGFGTLTDQEIQARFVAVLNAVNDLNGAMFYPETDPTYGTYAALFNRKLEAAAVKAAGGTLTAQQAQQLQEAHDAVLALKATPPPAIDQGPTLAAIADLKVAIANIKVTGGGLTPDQDAHLAAAEAASEKLEAAVKAAGSALQGA